MQILVSFSGGKDSQASLIWSIQKYGLKNVKAVFCDTGWDSPLTYNHIENVCSNMGVELVVLKSRVYSNFLDLAVKKQRFPSSLARFCTSELKVIPFIDYILDNPAHYIVIQGIRASESVKRSGMQSQCTYFKYYSTPYSENGKTHSYRKKEVLVYNSKFVCDIVRPLFDWSSQAVIDYIIDNGQVPHPFYSMGFKRVGCFPCFQSSLPELKELLFRFPERFDYLESCEKLVGTSFFKSDHIPFRFRSGEGKTAAIRYTLVSDMRNYLKNRNLTPDIFQDPAETCSSYYHLCE